jgi:hypothetical protein
MYALANIDVSKWGVVVSEVSLDDSDGEHQLDRKLGTHSELVIVFSSARELEMAVFGAP